MVQNPKGGGLSSSFGGGSTQQVGGVKQTGDFLDKATWFLATALILLILASNLTIDSGGAVESKAIDTNDTTDLPVSPAQPVDSSATPIDTTAN